MTCAKVRFLAIALPLGIAACSTSSSYPSLAYRDVERIGGSAMPAPEETEAAPPVLPPPSANLVSNLSNLLGAAQAANTQFHSNLSGAQRAVSGAGSRGSDSWSAASIALARLENNRSAGMAVMAQLDELYAKEREVAPNAESPSAISIGETRSQVSRLLETQDNTLAGLSKRLGN